MRLPWPFGRGTTSGAAASARVPASMGSDASGGAASPGSPAASAGDAERGRVAPPTGAWASLPPIQRTVGDAPLVAPTAPFLHDVPGHRPLPPIVQPLGHESRSGAPAGLVVAHATPVPTLTSQAAMPTRPVQRRAAAPTPDPVWTGAGEEAPVPSAAAAFEAAPAEPPAPVRRVTPVAPSSTVTPAPRPLTVAPPIAVSPGPVAQRSAAAAPAASAGPTASATAATRAATMSTPGTHAEPSMPLAPRGTVPARAGGRWSEGPVSTPRPGLGSPIPSVPPVAPAAQPAAAQPPETAALGAAFPASTTADLTTAPARAGLGAPLGSVPPTAIQRSTAPGALPLIQRIAAERAARSEGPGAVALPVGPGTRGAPIPPHPDVDPVSSSAALPSTVSPSAVSSSALPAARALPILPVSRRAAPTPGPATNVQRSAASSVWHDPAATPRSAPARADGMAATILPLLGARPLRPSLAIQREPDAGVRAAPSEPSTVPVPARWGAPDALPETVNASELPGVVHDAVPLQRLPAADTSAPEPVPALREMAFPAAALLGSPFPPATASTQPTRATVRREPAREAARATPALSLQRARPPGAQPQAAAGAGSQLPLASAPGQRIEAAPEATRSASGITVQTSPAAGLPTFTATPVVQRIDGAAPADAPAPAGHTDRELDDLARAMFGRLRGQLRAEVITEREARGLSFDAF